MLKIDLHLHSSEDPRDALDYEARDLIRRAAELGFNAVAITLHGRVLDSSSLREFAASRGVLYIPGIEKRIRGKELLVYNATQEEMDAVRSFDDLRTLKAVKGTDILIVAPHPFFKKSQCLGRHLEENIDLFDAIEYCHLYTKFWNLNHRAAEVATAYGKPMVATSDSHALWMFGRNYTWVDAPCTTEGIFHAVREGRVRPHSEPITVAELAKKMGWFWIVHEPRRINRWANGSPALPRTTKPGSANDSRINPAKA